ncbi:MAG: cell wall hydrolase, partial [Sphingomonadales bacterium]|nr:cell wall hydrolase [Sphingomonadales bacterium]
YQGSERSTGCQFTFTCDGALARRPVRLFWERAEMVARAALGGYVYAPVGLATHYHTFAVHPYWADSLHFLGQIGAHRFYRMAGPAGSEAAFRFAYAGGEPMAAPHARSGGPAEASPDPLAIERAYAAGLKAAHGDFEQAGVYAAHSIAALPAPVYATEALRRGGDEAFRARGLPGGDAVREEYRASGSWIATPE